MRKSQVVIRNEFFRLLILFSVLMSGDTDSFDSSPSPCAWTVWRHKRLDSTNLKQQGNQPFPLDHLRYCSLAHMCLFQIFPLFFRGRFDVIYANASPISSLIGTDHFYPIIFDTVLLLTGASFETGCSSTALA